MGKTPARARKYGMPVYAAAWPTGNTVYLAGGGGHGIKNRLVAATARGDALSDEVAALPLDDVPYRMAAHPSGGSLAVALSSGAVCRVDVGSGDAGGAPELTLATGEDAAALSKAHKGKVVALAFSGDGRLLALGGDDGSITVLQWPGLRVRAALSGDCGLPDGVKDLDFSGAHQQRVLAVACEDGSATLWDWEHAAQLIRLDLPEALRRGGSFNRVRFARDGSLGLYTVVNAQGRGHVLHWLQNSQGEVMLKSRESPVDGAITAFDISDDGAILGLGTSEGEAAQLSAATLKRLRRERQAHMVFATAVTMAPHGRALLSASADASVCVTTVAKRQRSVARSLLIPLLVLLLAIIVYYVHQVRGLDFQWHGSQQMVQELQTPYDSEL